MSTLASSLRLVSQSRTLTSAELECICAAASSEENRVLIDAAGEGLLATTPVHTATQDPTVDLGLIKEGSIILAPLLPPSSDLACLDNWVAYEVTNITPGGGVG